MLQIYVQLLKIHQVEGRTVIRQVCISFASDC